MLASGGQEAGLITARGAPFRSKEYEALCEKSHASGLIAMVYLTTKDSGKS